MPLPDTVFGRNTSTIITGASSGIGAAVAEEIAGHGGRVALVARRQDRLEQVAERVRARGGTPLVVAADVTDVEQVRAARERIVAEQGPVDVALLNAGFSDMFYIHRFETERAWRLFEVNVRGVITWLDVLLPDMISRGRGIIAATSSLAAHRGLPGNGCYGATKAAVSTLLDSLRVEAVRRGLQITIIEPGFVKSELTEGARVPMPFLMETADAARAIVEGVAEGKSVIRFPWQMAALVRVLENLPPALYDRVGGKMIIKRKR